MTDNFLKLKNIQKKYIDASKNIQVLNGVNLSLSKNNIVSLVGPSGSGKSTLLHILGLLETVDQGEYFFGCDLQNIHLKFKLIARIYKVFSAIQVQENLLKTLLKFVMVFQLTTLQIYI